MNMSKLAALAVVFGAVIAVGCGSGSSGLSADAPTNPQDTQADSPSPLDSALDLTGPAVDTNSGQDTGEVLIAATSLVDLDGFTYADLQDDPFPDHQPETVECEPDAYGLEDTYFEVETDNCNYLFVTQPTLEAVSEGEPIQIILAHDQLFAEDAVAHIAVSIGGNLMVEHFIELPKLTDGYLSEIPAPADFPKGTIVAIHLHNHGANNWQLFDLSVLRPLAAPSN
jgi:hypothetical protein